MSGPSDQIRIRLEGRLEILEAAIARYERLALLLRGNWRRRAIEEREAVQRFLAEEPTLDAALDHAVRVSQRDGWPADAEARKVSARIGALRKALQVRLLAMKAGSTWGDAVARLDAVSKSVRLPEAGELVLMEGTAARAMPLWVLTLAPTVLAMSWWGAAGALTVVVSMLCFGLAVLPLGRYVLLVDRLVWLPYRGVPIQLPLTSLAPELTRRNSGVTIGGKLSLPVVTSPVQLVALIDLYSEGPLKGINQPPSGTVVYLPAFSSRAGVDLEGFVLLHREGLCFLQKGTAPLLLQQILRPAAGPHDLELRALPLPVSEAFLFEQLSRLPSEQLATVLAPAASLPGGICVGPDQVIADRMRDHNKLRLRAGGTLLEIPLEAVDLEALRTLFPWTQDTSRQVP